MREHTISQEPVIHFLAEQDGETERKLKTALVGLFTGGVKPSRAYLVRVRYGAESAENVVLAVIAAADQGKSLIAGVQKVFH